MTVNESPARVLNETLQGSPYSVPEDEQGQNVAFVLLSKCDEIQRRWVNVENMFTRQVEEIRSRIARISDAESIYESNRIEYAGLPLNETRMAIENAPSDLEILSEYVAKLTVTSDQHLIEVLGLHQANLFAKRLAEDYRREGSPIRERDVRDLHRFTVPFERHRGSYRSVNVEISGAHHRPSDPLEIPRQMGELVNWMNESTRYPILTATVVHSWLAATHPFEDGNGRVARLLANTVLLKGGWPPLIVRNADRAQYMEALAHSDVAGDLLPLFDLFVKSVRRGLKKLEDPDLAVKLFDADLRLNTDARYDVWISVWGRFKRALMDRLNDRQWTTDFFGDPPKSNYILTEQQDASGNMWLAKLKHLQTGSDLLVWLGYMSTNSRDWIGGAASAPSIFFSERDRRPLALHPYKSPFSESPLAVEEITLLPSARQHQVVLRYGYLTYLECDAEDAADRVANAVFQYASG